MKAVAQAPALLPGIVPEIDPQPNDRHLTPRWILDIAAKILGGIDLDPCGAPGWKTATTVILPPLDGLSIGWGTASAWVNPPYSNHAAWLDRCRDHCGPVIALVMADPVKAWWRDCQPELVAFLHKRVRFLDPEQNQQGSPPFASALLGWRINPIAWELWAPHANAFRRVGQ
jgi:hypothetical protein